MPQLTLCEEMRDCFGFQLVGCILQTTIVSPKLIARACIGQEDGIVHSGAEALDGEALPQNATSNATRLETQPQAL
jgi:hypothetical protein